MKKSLIVIMSHMLCRLAFAQGEYIVEIDRETGQFVKTGPAITDVTYIYPGLSTFNENSNTYIFPSAQIENKLYSIDTEDGSIVNNPLINISELRKFQVHNTNNTLYGIQDIGSRYFVSIDPVSGATNQIGTPLPNSSNYAGYSTINELDNRFTYLAPTATLNTIDIANGALISSPDLVLSSGESIINFKYDNTSGSLYGLLQDNNSSQYFLATIDPETGAVESIGNGSPYGIGGGSATIDEANQQYIYLYHDGTGNYKITTLDLLTGGLLYDAIIPTSSQDNFVNIEFDNTTGKLYSMHWDSQITTSIEEIHNLLVPIEIYPNPTSRFINIGKIDCDMNEIKIYNILGQDFTEFVFVNYIEPQIIEIDLLQLNPGLYYVNTKNAVIKVYKE